jgi:hypothetical protein
MEFRMKKPGYTNTVEAATHHHYCHYPHHPLLLLHLFDVVGGKIEDIRRMEIIDQKNKQYTLSQHLWYNLKEEKNASKKKINKMIHIFPCLQKSVSITTIPKQKEKKNYSKYDP